MLQKLYSVILKMEGHDIVYQASNGIDCISKISMLTRENDNYPDFILMDHRMPIKNGFDTMIELLERDPGLKIIFISADLSVRSKALSSGAVSFIEKPFDLKDFLSVLEEISSL